MQLRRVLARGLPRRRLCMHDVPIAQPDLADQSRVGQQLPAADEEAQRLGRQV